MNNIEYNEKDKGYTGLVNLGNTCFLNSCIQILNHTYELVDVLNHPNIGKIVKQNIPEYSLMIEWNELRELMWSNNGVVSPNKFVFNIHKLAREKKRELFTGWAQNDMSEFLLFFIECIHNTISQNVGIKISGKKINEVDDLAIQCYTMLQSIYTKDYSKIMDIFYGIYVSQIISRDGKSVHSNKPELYFILDLPIPVENDKKTIYDCFDLFTQVEVLENENEWFNEKTGVKENIQKRIVIWNFPNILVITLKRFSFDGETKINKLIEFPLDNLNLSRYVKGYNSNSFIYELYGICNHYGSIHGGHYSSFVKNASNQWVHYNDTNVNIINSENELITSSAYCLFYRKKIT